jgi:hypothetical protein
MAFPFAHAMYVTHQARAIAKRHLRNLLPTHFDFGKTKAPSSFGKSKISASIRWKTVEDGFKTLENTVDYRGRPLGVRADGEREPVAWGFSRRG